MLPDKFIKLVVDIMVKVDANKDNIRDFKALKAKLSSDDKDYYQFSQLALLYERSEAKLSFASVHTKNIAGFAQGLLDYIEFNEPRFYEEIREIAEAGQYVTGESLSPDSLSFQDNVPLLSGSVPDMSFMVDTFHLNASGIISRCLPRRKTERIGCSG